MKIESMEDLLNETGTYASIRYNEASVAKLRKWCEEHDVPKHRAYPETIHTTLLYSRKKVDNVPLFENHEEPLIAYPKELVIWDTQTLRFGLTRALVLIVDCPAFNAIHQNLVSLGGVHGYPEYIPHITLSYDVGQASLKSFGKISTRIKLEAVRMYTEDLHL